MFVLANQPNVHSAVALGVAVAVAVDFIGFGATIRTRQDIGWSPVSGILNFSVLHNADQDRSRIKNHHNTTTTKNVYIYIYIYIYYR